MNEGAHTLVVGIVRNSVSASSSIVTVVEVSTGPITAESDVDDNWRA